MNGLIRFLIAVFLIGTVGLVAEAVKVSAQTAVAPSFSWQSEKNKAGMNEKYRPQFHYTPRVGWVNDPNGCVFYKGEYHLFYQHNPSGLTWDNMHWGHAISRDLVHWLEQPEALAPDSLGDIWSGSAVVDHANTAGFGAGAMVCIYTAAGKQFGQCVASSTNGRNFVKFHNNPVLPQVVAGDRDPKVIWHEPTKQWIMVLYLDKHDFALFGSLDLKRWVELSRFSVPGFNECPDFFPLALDGDRSRTKWIFTSGTGKWWERGSKYVVGEFDGRAFKMETSPLELDRGCLYSTQSFSDIPEEDGRRIWVSWISRENDKQRFPGMPFNGTFCVPRVLTLRTTPEGPRIRQLPVREIESLRGPKHAWKAVPLISGNSFASGIDAGLLDIDAEIDLDTASAIVLQMAGTEIRYDAKQGTLQACGRKAALAAEGRKLKLRIMADRTILEIFSREGDFAMAGYFTPPEKIPQLSIRAEGGSARMESLTVYEMKSIWQRQ
jgi:sucrose-6-phosphate hydrolase SacC (GH32 family)